MKLPICKIMARRASWSNCNCTNLIIYLLGNFLTSQCWVRIIVSPFFPLYFPFHLLDIRYNRCIFMARRASWSNCSVQTASSIYWVTFYLGKKLDQEGVKIKYMYLARDLGKKSRIEIGPRRRNQDGIKI